MSTIHIVTESEEIEWIRKHGKPLESLGFIYNDRLRNFQANMNGECLPINNGLCCMSSECIAIKINYGCEIELYLSDIESDWCTNMAHKAIDAIKHERLESE